MSQYTTVAQIQTLVERARVDIAALGYPEVLDENHYLVRLSNHMTRTCGQCTRKRKGQLFDLAFSTLYLKNASDQSVIDTVYHEVAHSVHGGDGHTGGWAICAAKINKAYGSMYGIRVTQYDHDENYSKVHADLQAHKTRYTPVCLDCGMKFRTVTKRTKAIQWIEKGNPQGRYYCTRCKSKNLEIRTTKPNF